MPMHYKGGSKEISAGQKLTGCWLIAQQAPLARIFINEWSKVFQQKCVKLPGTQESLGYESLIFKYCRKLLFLFKTQDYTREDIFRFKVNRP